MRAFHVLAVSGILAVGCGGGGGGDVSLNDFPAEAADAFCAKIFECCDQQEIMEQFSIFNPPITTEAQCVTAFTGFYQLAFGETQAAIDAGKMKYHADRAGACLDAVRDLSCSQYAMLGDSDTFPGCEDPFEGLVAADQACADDDECVSGYCEGDTQEMTGTCKTEPGSGAACPDFQCASGLYCEFGAAGSTCQPTKADGAQCTSDEECQSDNCDDASGLCAAAAPTCDGV
jgi:hypothetical protein